jgi:hypothetical protein
MRAHRALSLTNKAEGAREVLEQELVNSLLKTKKFSTFLPVCARCKRIRDGTGGWRNQLEYLGNNFEGKYTHTICPACAKKLYPEIFGKTGQVSPG